MFLKGNEEFPRQRRGGRPLQPERTEYAGYVKGTASPWSLVCHRTAWHHTIWLKHWVTGQNVGLESQEERQRPGQRGKALAVILETSDTIL